MASFQQTDAFKQARSKWGLGNVLGSLAPAPAAIQAVEDHQPHSSAAHIVEVLDAGSQTEPNAITMNSERIANALERIANALEANAIQQPAAPSVAAPSVPPIATTVAKPVQQASKPVLKPISPPTKDDVKEEEEEESESDIDVDPASRCGVCKKGLEDQYALDCGHYPFCLSCVEELMTESTSTGFFQCPYCKKLGKGRLFLKL